MPEPHEIFTPDLVDQIIYVTPNCHLSPDLALRFSKIIPDVPRQREEPGIPTKPNLSGIIGRQPNSLL